MKNPFIAGDSSGFTGLMVGSVLLVFVAVGLTLLIDGDIHGSVLSSSSAELRDRNDVLRGKINQLEVQQEIERRRQATSAKHREQVKYLEELEGQVAKAREEADVLRQLIRSQRESIKLITQGLETHRLQYREHIRAAAVGETYDKIVTPLGKEYSDVCIKSVGPTGVSISHSTGASRLGYREMPEQWRERLRFTALEIAQATEAEQKRLASVRAIQAKRGKELDEIKKDASRRQLIASLHRQVASVSARLATARLEASLAHNKVSYNQSLRRTRTYARSSYRYYNTSTGAYYRNYYRPRYRITVNNTSKSVPGSLETWKQRAARYERASTRLASELAGLRSRLAAVDPTYVPDGAR